MANHEYWQFAFVKDQDPDTLALIRLGFSLPLIVEASNLPEGSIAPDTPVGDTAPLFQASGTLVQGNHIRVYYGLPQNPQGYTLTGRLKLRKKTKEFCRSHDDSTSTLLLDVTLSDVDEYNLHLDDNLQTHNSVWYYTIFYEMNDTFADELIWGYSPIHSHDRSIALRANDNQFGDLMYRYFPRAYRLRDSQEGDLTLQRLCKIMGRAFDEISDRLSFFSETRYSPESVDAAFIPYIDQLLGWPTNFELGELLRREETANIGTLWRSKGTSDSFALALQEVTGWLIDFSKGYDYVLTTATSEETLDPNNPPAGWDEATDGVWSDQVNQVPFNGTMDLTIPHTFSTDSPHSTVRGIYSKDSWKNTYGLLIDMIEPLVPSALSSMLARDKILRLMPYLAIHYAQIKIRLVENYSMDLMLGGEDAHQDTTQGT